MQKTAIITGTAFSARDFLSTPEQQIVKTMYGNVLLFSQGKIIYLPRHGKNGNIPPHKVNHKANLCALNLLGVERIIAVHSVGSLKSTIKPGSLVVPQDYVNFAPQSFQDFEFKDMIPQLNPLLRKKLLQAVKRTKHPVKSRAVYVQMQGPRLETKAEVKVIEKYGSVVGMTMAAEATLGQELGIPYVSLCHVDNVAHGLGASLTIASLTKMRKSNAKKVVKILKIFLR